MVIFLVLAPKSLLWVLNDIAKIMLNTNPAALITEKHGRGTNLPNLKKKLQKS